MVVIAARSMLQSGNWLMNVRGAGDDTTSSFFRVSTDAVKPTGGPFIFGGAWAFVLTCKAPEEADFVLIPPKLADTLPNLEALASPDGEGTGKNDEAAAAATMA
jgi:hypothetical protein